jgi:hypothetical protein
MKRFLLLVLILFTFHCQNDDANESNLGFSSPEFLALLGNNPVGTYYYFRTREVDQKLTTNCGIATPGTAATTPGQPGQTTPPPSTGGTGTTNTRFNVVAQIVFKETLETLSFRFTYDTVQFSGPISPQQGFTLTGGVFNNTVTGTQGTVTWSGQGAGFIDEATTGQQTLSFLNVNVDLRGTFIANSTGVTTAPQQCFTQDNINCTSITTTTQCFTTDNQKCLSSTTSTGTPIFITGSIKCNSRNVVQ